MNKVMAEEDDSASANQVYLRGRLGDGQVVRELPSGDMLITFRLTVPRPERKDASRARVDSIECASTSARVRRSVERAAVGDVLEVTGSLQRRFWRSALGSASRYAVNVEAASKVRRAGRPVSASPSRKRASA